MFTGIVQKTGQVTRAEARGAESLLRVATGFGDLELGESVAVNGVCLTVVESDRAGEALFHVSPETLARTSLGQAAPGRQVNLERALRASDRLSGHIVQGHVDGLARIARLEPQGECWILEVELPENLSRYCTEKGSIALNGVSLTVNSIAGTRVSIQLIPHTHAHTEFRERRAGDAVNVEVDVLAKYAEKLLQPFAGRQP